MIRCLTVGLLLIASAAVDAATNRLVDIQARGALECGIWPHVAGFAVAKDGRYSGFDIDICRAVAAAILGDPDKVRFVPLETVSQFAARADVDIVVRRLTWTLSRESANDVVFGPVTFYDGQGFLVPRSSGVRSAAQLAGEAVCVIDAEHHAKTLHDYFEGRGHPIRLVLVETDAQAEKALNDKRCEAYSADLSWLGAARSGFRDGLARYEILSDVISKEPLAPLMRARDRQLVQRVRWTLYSMIEAEELGLSSHNVRSAGPRAQSLVAVIAGVGNYGEVFDRNLGASSPIKLDRGLNRLWSQGGLLYAPPR
jgi:general L-amino acid transport system substrate-binding protein